MGEIKWHQQFDLQGYKAFEKVVVDSSMSFQYSMPDEACFYYILKGRSTIISGLNRADLESEEGLVMQCGTYLGEILSVEDDDSCEAIAIHLAPHLLKDIFENEVSDILSAVDRVQPVVFEKFQASELLQNYIQSLQFYFENPELVSEELLRLKLKELIYLLARTDNADAVRKLLSGLFNPVEANFKDVVRANLYNNLGLEELATLNNMSLSSFKQEFKRHYDASPGVYIREKKLEKAEQMLRSTNLRIADVCDQCGFADQSHFSKLFHKAYGFSPSQYRLSHNS